jgi:hypothetical protein
LSYSVNTYKKPDSAGVRYPYSTRICLNTARDRPVIGWSPYFRSYRLARPPTSLFAGSQKRMSVKIYGTVLTRVSRSSFLGEPRIIVISIIIISLQSGSLHPVRRWGSPAARPPAFRADGATGPQCQPCCPPPGSATGLQLPPRRWGGGGPSGTPAPPGGPLASLSHPGHH